MEERKIMQRLREKLDRNWAAMQANWFALSPSVIVGKAEEINATRLAYNELFSGWAYSEDKLEYLLRFDNPLEVVRDKWIEEQCLPDISAEMNHVLCSVMDKQEAEQDYALDKEYTDAAEQDNGMKMS